jgi:deoxycytidylate deaminase
MIVSIDGTIVFGSNKMMNNVPSCPREEAKFVSGEGYHMCKDICGQVAHAEVDAINTALENNVNIIWSTLTLVGHTYCCDNCTAIMKKHGVKIVKILADDGSVATRLDLAS